MNSSKYSVSAVHGVAGVQHIQVLLGFFFFNIFYLQLVRSADVEAVGTGVAGVGVRGVTIIQVQHFYHPKKSGTLLL